MSAQRTAYLLLERLLIEAEQDTDAYANVLCDSMMPFWEALDPSERAALQARGGDDPDAINQTVIRDPSGPVRSKRSLVAYVLLERVMMDCERMGDRFAETVRENLPPFWDAVPTADRVALQARVATSSEPLNPSRIDELATHVVAVVPWNTMEDDVASTATIDGAVAPGLAPAAVAVPQFRGRRVIDAQQLVRPERLLVATYDAPEGADVSRVVLSCRYVPAVDATGTVAIAIELAFDPVVPQPASYYYCPVARIQRLLLAPRRLTSLRPFLPDRRD